MTAPLTGRHSRRLPSSGAAARMSVCKRAALASCSGPEREPGLAPGAGTGGTSGGTEISGRAVTLVDQDSTDEHVSALLDRISAERARTDNKPPRRRREAPRCALS